MTNLHAALTDYFGHEGLYSNDPKDPGGETWMGIARKRHPGWRGWSLIDELRPRSHERQFVAKLTADLDLGEAVEDFYSNEWRRLGLDKISSPAVAAELFEAGQNTGPRRAIGWLQAVLNAMNRNEKDWPDVTEDRRLGPKTLAAFAAALKRRGEAEILVALNGRQFMHYWGLARRNPKKWEWAFNGFLRRVSFRR